MSSPTQKTPRRESASDNDTAPPSKKPRVGQETMVTAWEAAVAAYPAEFQAVYPTRQDIPKGSQVGNYLADLPAVDGALQEHRPASSFSMRMIHKKSGGALAQRVIQQANEKMKAVHNLKAVLGQASGTPRPVACDRCASNKGLWQVCMKASIMPNTLQRNMDTLNGICPNCYLNGGYLRCFTNGKSPSEIISSQSSSQTTNDHSSSQDTNGESSSQALKPQPLRNAHNCEVGIQRPDADATVPMSVNATIERPIADNAHLISRVGELQSTVEAYDARAQGFEEFRIEVKERLRKVDKVEAMIEKSLSAHDTPLKSQSERLRAMFEELQSQIEQHQVKLEEGEANLKKSEATLMENEASLEETEINLDEIRRDLDDTEANLDSRQADLDNRQAYLDNFQATLDERQACLDKREANLEDTEAKLKESQARVHGLQAEVNDLQATVAALEDTFEADILAGQC